MRFHQSAIWCGFVATQAITAVPPLVAAPAVADSELPKLPAPSLEQSLAALRVKSGFQVEIAAAEPQVVDPVAMAFDAAGALYVVEMRDYPLPERRDRKMGTVRKLMDQDGDGRFEKATLFMKDLPWPTGIACSKDGVYVLASPDLWFAKDTNGDGGADEQRRVASGFGAGRDKPNVQALPNSLTWGPDGRIWGATAGNGGTVNGKSLNGHDFSIDPLTDELRPEIGTAQFGLTFDESGRRFVCSNSHHLQWVPWEQRHLGNLALPESRLIDIPQDGAAAPVFRSSPEEAWRVVRTKWRATGQVPGIIEGGGRSSGYFTSACGLHCYRGDAFPPEYVGNFFICDVGSNLVHRKVIEETKDGLVARRSADETDREFLSSSSNWFRPVACTTGPDGALYIADMAREIIEHPDSLPDAIKRHLDLASGENLGRIWRIVPTGRSGKTSPLPAAVGNEERIALLDHPNAWHRETAQRLLLEEKAAASTILRKSGVSPLGLPILARHGTLTLADLEQFSHGGQLGQSVGRRIAFWLPHCQDLNGEGISRLLQVWQNSQDPFFLSELPAAMRLLPAEVGRTQLRQLYKMGIPRVEEAVRFSLSDPAMAMDLAKDTRSLKLWEVIGKSRDAAVIRDALTYLESLMPLPVAELAALGAVVSAKTLDHMKSEIKAGRTNPAVITLLLGSKPADQEFLMQCLHDARIDIALKIRLIAVLEMPSMERLAVDWKSRPIRIRQEMVEWLLRTPGRSGRLVEWLKEDRIAREEISMDQIARLRRLRPAESNTLFGPVVDRQEIVRQRLGVLELTGTATAGERHFRQRCLVCHQHGTEGNPVGPERKTFRNLGKPILLVNVLDPSREVAGAYQMVILQTKAGEAHAGLLVSENNREVRLRTALGQEMTVPRDAISSMTPVQRSLMPDGLENGLTDQDLADLLEFLIQP